MNFNFQINKNVDKARLGIVSTPHGIVETPAFIFCATKACMKTLTMEQMKQTKTQFVLSNTYHLLLQPGGETVEKLGGLQKMTGWHGPMLTDSGGFQIFSLGHGSVASEIKGKKFGNVKSSLIKINEDGAIFRSYINGQTINLTPELSMHIQRQLGADFIVVLDECTPFHVDKYYTQQSMKMSHRWAIRSLNEWQKHDNGKQKVYGIVQGGVYNDLRQESCEFVNNNNNFYGIAVGGSLGADKSQMHDVVSFTMEKLRKDRPIHLLGIGGVSDIFNGVAEGIDTFDCVHPTRLARHGGALVKKSLKGKEHINLRNSVYKNQTDPIDFNCDCSTCLNYSTGYIHHLLKAKEITAYTLISVHNVRFMNRLMENIRLALQNNSLSQLKSEYC